jgi:isoaspartyl peptidase/L-asparaginase-like protein (Ntn-hydrolase superfamily)
MLQLEQEGLEAHQLAEQLVHLVQIAFSLASRPLEAVEEAVEILEQVPTL